MKRKLLLLGCLMASSFYSMADMIPMLGNLKAEKHQVCGKDINVQIKNMDNQTVMIGLINKTTHKMDLFLSTEMVSPDYRYAKFIPVNFDGLSKNYIPVDNSDLDIVWGSALNEKKISVFSLALGPVVYQCNLMQKWPSEKSNEFYGESS